MRITARLVGLVAAVVLPLLLVSTAISVLAVRDGLRERLRLHNQEAAAALAAAWAGRAADDPAAQALAQMAFDAGAHRSLSVLRSDGAVLFERRRESAAGGVPAWFAAALALEPDPGRAPVTGPAGSVASIEVQGSADAALRALWRTAERSLALLGVLAALALLLTAWLARSLRRPLAAIVAQARAIEQARFVTAKEPALPELREVTRALNAMVLRLREMFDRQAEQVSRLQSQAQTDGVTGLALRAPFTSLLGERLADLTAGPAALLLVRLANLERLNERHGREAADRLLQRLADILLTYVERVPGSGAGRLNGTDFALFLPAAGIAQETAESLRGALEAAPGVRQAGAEFVLGGCDGLRGVAAGAALAAADAALANAEQGEGIAVVSLPEVAGGGARAWREQIADALAQGRVGLGAFPVVDAAGRLIHLECPLRVQLEPGGEFQVARRWLALAARSRLLPEVDLAALSLALAAIAADGRPRCVHVALRSFADPEFGAAVQARLDAHAEAAARLSIEWEPSPRAGADTSLRAAVGGWRQRGVTLGVEHAGAAPKALAPLKELGVSYVKVDAQHLRALASDEAVRDYAAGLATLILGLGMRPIAEGVDEPRDLAALWALGFEGATGSAVSARSN